LKAMGIMKRLVRILLHLEKSKTVLKMAIGKGMIKKLDIHLAKTMKIKN